MDSRHNDGTYAGNEAAVPVVRPETGQAARCDACGSSRDVSRNGRAGVDDDGTP